MYVSNLCTHLHISLKLQLELANLHSIALMTIPLMSLICATHFHTQILLACDNLDLPCKYFPVQRL